jgi:predicted ribosome quality control (RQC) complex YloA/Tae2 family protein
LPASDAVLALRKYVLGGRITALRKALADRIILVDIENCRFSNQSERLSLAIELIPNRVRACLLDHRQLIQLWLWPTPGVCGIYSPPAAAGRSVESIREEEFRSLIQLTQGLPELAPIAGLSRCFAREVLFQGQQDSGKSWQALQALLQRVSNGPYSPRIYHVERPLTTSADNSSRSPATKQVIAPFALECLGATPYEPFPSMNVLSVELLRQVLERENRPNGVDVGNKKLAAEIKKKRRLKEKLETQLAKATEARCLKTYADLIYLQHDKSARHQGTLRVANLFDPALGEVDIPLEPELSLVENANRYHRLYRKAERSIPKINERLHGLELEIAELQRRDESLGKGPSCSVSWPQREPPAAGKPAASRLRLGDEHSSNPEAQVRRVAKAFRTSEGMHILVGKSSRDNDTLTMKIARGDDFWLHVAGYGGSHVVLRNPEKLPTAPKQSLLEAAQLAAYFSQARNAPKVEVHYTQKKFVSKPKGAKPGLVRLKEYRSIFARPQLPEEQREE